jgi:hypothetical protein
MECKIRYQVSFKEDTAHGRYSDALYYDNLPDQKTIDDDARKRIDSWITLVETPPVPEIPLTKEQLESELGLVDGQILNLQEIRASLISKIEQLSINPIIGEEP